MYQVTAEARARALAGEGPTLIEAITYRLGAHTTADDPTRYVDPDEEQRWKRTRDPLIRFRAWMRATGRWDDAAEAEASAWCSAEIDRAVEQVAAVGAGAPELLFDNVSPRSPRARRPARRAAAKSWSPDRDRSLRSPATQAALAARSLALTRSQSCGESP